MVLSSLAEPHHDRRLLLEVLLFVPLLLCSVRIFTPRRS
jgi:hypothetical protein